MGRTGPGRPPHPAVEPVCVRSAASAGVGRDSATHRAGILRLPCPAASSLPGRRPELRLAILLMAERLPELWLPERLHRELWLPERLRLTEGRLSVLPRRMAEKALRRQAAQRRPGDLLREAGKLRLLKALCHQVHDQALRDETDDRHEARHLRLTKLLLRLTKLLPVLPGLVTEHS